MSRDAAASGLMRKAARAVDSARAVLALDDVDGACNRADYAMFDAARAALPMLDDSGREASAKTHRGLLNAFSERFIRAGIFDHAVGRSLKRAEEICLVADYRDDSIKIDDARLITDQAASFVDAIGHWIGPRLQRRPSEGGGQTLADDGPAA